MSLLSSLVALIVPTVAAATSATNRLVYSVVSSSQPDSTDIMEYDNDGAPSRLLLTVSGHPGDIYPVLSPDGHWLAYGEGYAIGLYDLTSNVAAATLAVDHMLGAPAWSHDSKSIVFSNGDTSSTYILRVAVTTSGFDAATFARVGENPNAELMPAWSTDDTQIVFAQPNPNVAQDRFGQTPQSIYVMSATDGSGLHAVTNTDVSACRDMWPSYLAPSRIVFDRLCANANTRAVFAIDPSDGPETRYSTPPLTDWNVTVSADGNYVATQCGMPEGGTHICMIDNTTGARADLTNVFGFNGVNISFQEGSSAPAVPQEPLHIVGLGDSVAAGEGLGYGITWKLDKNGKDGQWIVGNPAGTWLDDGTTNATECHRSPGSYQQLVAAQLNAKFLELACTGASVQNGLLNDQTHSDDTITGAEVGDNPVINGVPNPSYISSMPDVVLLTVGADDVNFVTVLEDCYGVQKGVTSRCRNDKIMKDLLDRQKKDLDLLLSVINTLGASSHKVPRILLTGYFNPFPTNGATCRDLNPAPTKGLDATSLVWIKKQFLALNGNIQAITAKYADATYVDISKVMAGHTFCTHDPWVYGPSIKAPKIFGGAGQSTNSAPFHPTTAGDSAIAAAVLTAFRQ